MIFTPHLAKVLKLSQMHRCSRQPTKPKGRNVYGNELLHVWS